MAGTDKPAQGFSTADRRTPPSLEQRRRLIR